MGGTAVEYDAQGRPYWRGDRSSGVDHLSLHSALAARDATNSECLGPGWLMNCAHLDPGTE